METEQQSDQDYQTMIKFLDQKNIRYFSIEETEKTNQIINILLNLGCIK